MMTAPCFVVLPHGYQFDTSSLFSATLSIKNRILARSIPLVDYNSNQRYRVCYVTIGRDYSLKSCRA